MEKNKNWKNMKTVLHGLKAPLVLAARQSGNNKSTQYRTIFMSDRDRITYSKSFRRLAGKTQVFLSGNDDHKRTRLTHTLEVAQIAKTIAEHLRLDVNLTEAIALGHDIGHTPFGHAGEQTLHLIMTPNSSPSILYGSPFRNVNSMSPEAASSYQEDSISDSATAKKDGISTEILDISSYCGFKHNLQSAAVAIDFERDYSEYGLDLCNFTLYGMASHSSLKYKRGEDGDKLGYYEKYKKAMLIPGAQNEAWSLEAFVVAEADEIAQRHHDLEDAIRGNLISMPKINQKIQDLFRDYLKEDKSLLRQMNKTVDVDVYVALLSRMMVNMFVTRLLVCSTYNINHFIVKHNLYTNQAYMEYLKTHSSDEAKTLIAYDYIDKPSEFQPRMKEFEDFITKNVISSYEIQRADAHGQYLIKKLFQAYFKTPVQLPDHCIEDYFLCTGQYSYKELQTIIKTEGIGKIRSDFADEFDYPRDPEKDFILMRVICNHIAGMTDTYAQKTFEALYL